MLATFLLNVSRNGFGRLFLLQQRVDGTMNKKFKATVLGHIPPVTWPLCNRILIAMLQY